MGARCSTLAARGVAKGPQLTRDESDEDAGSITSPLLQLNDDVLLLILSYVSYAPSENDVSGTLTLDAIQNPSDGGGVDDETKRLLQDYNAGASKLNKKLRRGSSISPFQSAQYYYMEAFHGDASNTDTSLSRLNSPKQFGTLTHLLPLVCKRFHMLCNQSDVLWNEAIERLMGLRVGGLLWEEGIVSFIRQHEETSVENDVDKEKEDMPGKVIADKDDSIIVEKERIRGLVSKACDCRRKDTDRHEARTSVAREVYRQVLMDHKPLCLPVFQMPCRAMIGEEIDLRLFEPRYRLLIKEITYGRPENETSGYPLSTPRPRFLFACKAENNWRNAVACIVEVRRCAIGREGIGFITIVPISWVIFSKLQTRPESGGLRDGTVLQSPIRKRLPAFCMRTHLILGESIRIRLIEERYKIMIWEVMSGRTIDERNGGDIAEPRPQFVFICNNNRFREGDIACLVDVERCRIHSDGSAQVTVMAKTWVLVEAIAMRPKSRKLYDASVIYPFLQELAH